MPSDIFFSVQDKNGKNVVQKFLAFTWHKI